MKRNSKIWLWGMVTVAVLFGWHFLDVRAGASATGDGWLRGRYLWLGASVLGGLGIFGYALRKGEGKGRQIPLESLYAAAGLCLGILYMAVLPPLSAPDEVSHYISAYQLSSRILGQPSNSATGHVLVRAQDMWLEDVDGIYRYETGEDGYARASSDDTETARILGGVLAEETYRTLREQGITGRILPDGGRPMEADEPVVSVQPPVVTTPIAYVPQAIGIAAARLLHLNAVGLVFLGRVCNLLFFVGMTWLAMRRLPFGKEVLFGVALLPMTLHLSASMSYDVLIMGSMFYLTAVCLDLAFEKERVTLQDVAVLAVIMAAAGPCKMIYGVFMGLCLLIPVRKFGGVKGWGLAALAVAGAWAVSMAAVNAGTIAAYAAETESSVPWGEEAAYSFSYVLHHPYETAKIFYQTLLWQLEVYHRTMIGGYLGNLDEILDVPYGAVVLFTVCLLCLAMKKPGESQRMSAGNRIWIGVLCGGCAFGAMFSMLIAWTALSSAVISGVQGRYFLPFLPVLLMALKNDTIVLTKNGNRSILYLMCCANGYVLVRLYATVCIRL